MDIRLKALIKGIAAALVISVIASSGTALPASAGVPTNPIATPSNASPGATANLNLNFSNYQTAVGVRCIRTEFTGGYKPTTAYSTFDSSTEGWVVGWGANSVYSDTNSHQGTRSLGLNVTADGSTQYFSAGQPDALRNWSAAGDTVSAWVRLPPGSTGTWKAAIRLYDANYGITPAESYKFMSAGNWVRITRTFPNNELASFRSLLVEFETSGFVGTTNVQVDQIESGFAASNQIDGDMPLGLNLSAATTSGSFINNQAWTTDVSRASSGIVTVRNATGIIPTGSNASFVLNTITQPTVASGQTVYATMTTYSAQGTASNCAGSILDGPVTFTYTTSSSGTVAVAIDPTMSFTVAGYTSGTCNGATINRAASTGSAVDLGNLNSSANVVAGQTLSVTSNAASGVRVLSRSLGSLNDGRGNDLDDVTGTDAAPAAFPAAAEAFGYTTDGALSSSATRFQTNKWSKFTTGNQEVLFGTSTATATGHVCLQAGVTAATTAGTYTTTILYTAVPSY